MVSVLADNVISPLGETSEENYQAVKEGKSAIHAYAPMTAGIPNGFVASLLSSDFEELAFRSAQKAIDASGINISSTRTVFILSSTKGSIEKLGQTDDDKLYLGNIAQRIATRLGIQLSPIVVCNACISGLAAMILASRLLVSKKYDYAVVCGADCPGRFIISGFQSLNAMSAFSCQPFDIERQGLNLGEAAATVVLGREITTKSVNNGCRKQVWQIGHGYIKNDAYHISSPSKTAEGLYEALLETMNGIDKRNIAFINAHGTATLFNDQMEAIAIHRAELQDIPVNALKGYVGHTLGAAGIMETILCMKAVDDHTVLGTRGYEEVGVSGRIQLSSKHHSTIKTSFIKQLSGFGGCNATLYARSVRVGPQGFSDCDTSGSMSTSISSCVKKGHQVHITPQGIWLDGKVFAIDKEGKQSSLLTALYKQIIGNYPKYYKMDGLCRLGFVASELLLKAERDEGSFTEDTNKTRAIVFFNRSSSIASDKKYLASIVEKDNYFPSPSVFVYTLPNIVTGEIAIRNGYHGETSFYILPHKNELLMQDIIETTFMDEQTTSVLTGWLDYEDSEHFEADLYIAYK
ncbi:3-oxoacyl-ACP synthase [Prevotella sp. HMSC077E09]|uniref:beta-ketoacyl synthase N-terminal-like domain-containing protein n=1 Tax=Prevotella sp. HMSC077E09 TaxID=1739487 RepID=UPI0008A5EBA9|nr:MULTISPECIES: beta-ketoacyl synthase N-terminal-like domain-containing protein [unclassified Prevotella]OFO76950.1 3-oxoacyl-ACP synthase [Prevotella sp. HMSC077E08]OFP56109.1 3-oxoacyl-ACP synthase [Prevotella sp. HMSC077E09]